MKKVFNGEINGVKYTNEEQFLKDLEELKARGAIKSLSYQTEEVDDEAQLDLFKDEPKKMSSDYLFPRIEQGIDAVDGIDEYILDKKLDQISEELASRIKFLKENFNSIDLTNIEKDINYVVNRIDQIGDEMAAEDVKRQKERDEIQSEIDDLQDKLNDIDYEEENDNNKLAVIDLFLDYYDDIEKEIKNRKLHNQSDIKTCTPKKKECPLKVEKNPVQLGENFNNDLEKLKEAFELLSKLWK